MWVRDFLATHPVFRWEDFRKQHEKSGSANRQTCHALLAYHVRRGSILRIRRGLFAAVSPGFTAETLPVDPYLVAVELSNDAVVAFHAALQFHGKAHSLHSRFHYLSSIRRRPFVFRGQEFVAVTGGVPSWDPGLDAGVIEERHGGGAVRVTTLERTLVDVMALPQHGGGWEEVFRSLDSVEFLDVDRVVEDAIRRDSLTAARIGFYLDSRKSEWLVHDAHLDTLREHAPRQPWYMGPGRQTGGRLVHPWNLVVPEEILERSWEEPA